MTHYKARNKIGDPGDDNVRQDKELLRKTHPSTESNEKCKENFQNAFHHCVL